MKPYLWSAYDYTSTSECLAMLETILEKHPDNDIIHEIGRPTLLQVALEAVPIVSEFALAVGSAITRSNDPNAAVAQFQLELNQLDSRQLSNAPWAALER